MATHQHQIDRAGDKISLWEATSEAVELEGIPEGEIRKMIDHSYDLVVQGLPKAQRARLMPG